MSKHVRRIAKYLHQMAVHKTTVKLKLKYLITCSTGQIKDIPLLQIFSGLQEMTAHFISTFAYKYGSDAVTKPEIMSMALRTTLPQPTSNPPHINAG